MNSFINLREKKRFKSSGWSTRICSYSLLSRDLKILLQVKSGEKIQSKLFRFNWWLLFIEFLLSIANMNMRYRSDRDLSFQMRCDLILFDTMNIFALWKIVFGILDNWKIEFLMKKMKEKYKIQKKGKKTSFCVSCSFYNQNRPASRRCLNSPCGSYLSVRAFQSCGRRVRKWVITFLELRFWAALHLEQSVCIASGRNSETHKTERVTQISHGFGHTSTNPNDSTML